MKDPSQCYQLHTAETRPDLWDAVEKDRDHPLNTAWPIFLDQDQSQVHFYNSILKYSGLRKFQFAIVARCPVTGRETTVAFGQSIPFFWPELEKEEEEKENEEAEVGDGGSGGLLSAHSRIWQSLPDGGWDTIVSRGVRQYLAREGLLSSSALPVITKEQEQDLATCQDTRRPNALSALAVTISPDHRRLGLAERLIDAMKQTAREEHLRVLVAPIRPTRKFDFPFVPMEEYITWTTTTHPNGTSLATSSLGLKNGHPTITTTTTTTNDKHKQPLPFDPWLRKHVRMGGKVVKIAPSSMVVEGSIAEWEEWTGVDFRQYLLPQGTQREKDSNSRNGTEMTGTEQQQQPECNREYVEVAFPGGLVPLRIDVEEKRGVYMEPNVWLYHDVARI